MKLIDYGPKESKQIDKILKPIDQEIIASHINHPRQVAYSPEAIHAAVVIGSKWGKVGAAALELYAAEFDIQGHDYESFVMPVLIAAEAVSQLEPRRN